MKNVSRATIPQALTAGVIAAELGQPIWRVQRILSTRPHIKPVAVAGTAKLYRFDAIDQVREALAAIDAARRAREVAHAR